MLRNSASNSERRRGGLFLGEIACFRMIGNFVWLEILQRWDDSSWPLGYLLSTIYVTVIVLLLDFLCS